MTQERKLGFMLGTGPDELTARGQETSLETPYGAHADGLYCAEVEGRELCLLLRHGKGHTVPPHRVNYRANLWALQQLGVTDVVSFGAAGSIRLLSRPGDFAIPLDFIDVTKQVFTFHDDDVVHTPMYEPFSVELSRRLLKCVRRHTRRVSSGDVYVGVHGPRYPTRAEIQGLMLKKGTLLGMTVTYEVPLAAELGLRYANLSNVTDNSPRVSHDKVEARSQRNREVCEAVALELVRTIDQPQRDLRTLADQLRRRVLPG